MTSRKLAWRNYCDFSLRKSCCLLMLFYSLLWNSWIGINPIWAIASFSSFRQISVVLAHFLLVLNFCFFCFKTKEKTKRIVQPQNINQALENSRKSPLGDLGVKNKTNNLYLKKLLVITYLNLILKINTAHSYAANLWRYELIPIAIGTH